MEYEGKVALSDDDQLKQELWTDYMENWFKGPDDPNYIVLEITPAAIRIMNKKGAEPKAVEF